MMTIIKAIEKMNIIRIVEELLLLLASREKISTKSARLPSKHDSQWEMNVKQSLKQEYKAIFSPLT